MPFSTFGEDDDFGWQHDDAPPRSPVRAAVAVDLDAAEVQEMERLRQARLLEIIETKRAEAKRIYALKRAATVPGPVLDLPSTPGASSASISFVPLSGDGLGLVVASATVAPSVTLPVQSVKPVRVLNRHTSGTTDDPVVYTARFAKRRRIHGKSSNNQPGTFQYATPVTLPLVRPEAESTMHEAATTVNDAAVANQGVLRDPVIADALAGLSSDILENKLINGVAIRGLCRQGVNQHCREPLLSKISKGLLGEKAIDMSEGRKLQWAASNYLTSMNDMEKCRLYRCIIKDLRRDHQDEQLIGFLCFIYRKEQQTADDADEKHCRLKTKNCVLTYQGPWGIPLE